METLPNELLYEIYKQLNDRQKCALRAASKTLYYALPELEKDMLEMLPLDIILKIYIYLDWKSRSRFIMTSSIVYASLPHNYSQAHSFACWFRRSLRYINGDCERYRKYMSGEI